MSNSLAECFTRFRNPIDGIPLPGKFTFPFDYVPYPLCRVAAGELQEHLASQTEWEHDFGIDHHVEGTNVGKMFGVMVVAAPGGEVGYLSAFSGKLAGGNHHRGFVPPVVDLLREDGFYRQGENEISAINHHIDALEKAPGYIACMERWGCENSVAKEELELYRTRMKAAKRDRDATREKAQHELPEHEFQELKDVLKNESLKWQYDYKMLAKRWEEALGQSRSELNVFSAEIEALKEERKTRSSDLQQRMFDQYTFLNILGEVKNLREIFLHTDAEIPPAGAGDCAAPKLLQYAFLNNLLPLAMAEFWWGQSPSSEIRKHGCFYPSCRSKCEPILGHMLAGLPVDEKPKPDLTHEQSHINVVYEDECLLVIVKPAELLSVPGKTGDPSVQSIMRERYPEVTCPMIVHRLDMSTSGLMVLAKTMAVYHDLQDQFLQRSVKKRYVALLEGTLLGDEGVVDLPLRVDLDNRPHQLVCYEYGKPARTRWKVLNRQDGRTRVAFFPITGRTHQLRVHAAHPLGLNCPIVGDDLYGTRSNRLHLHAEHLEFTHPVSGKVMRFQSNADF